ncbi:MAG: 8-amino-7-oxononanoate synthase/2-amino-3-ketobutyrate coenzyme A ligase [Chlamydiae bacterium]|nr:8-amino-7-oxononanoate synthase/2-amino-3-ketobutyrate coenzyme A ligase [Chlamydiota bacterium]
MQASDPCDLFHKCYQKEGLFSNVREGKDNYYAQPILEGPLGPHMTFNGQKMIVWSINDYLGLAGHPEPTARAKEVLEAFGTAYPMGARLMSGFTQNHQTFEAKLAKFAQKESALLFNYGYLGVLGVITSIMGPRDTVIIDHDSHACIVDGAKLATTRRNQFRVFRHNDMDHLEKILKSINQDRKGGILIVTDGIYGMTGEVAPLKEICALKEKYNARLLVDDAHGIGIMGATGRGTGEHLGVQDKIDLYFSTFAKCFAGIGGFVAGDKEIIEHITWNARPVIFAKNLPLIYSDSLSATLDVIEREPERREKLWEIATYMQRRFKEEGFDIGNTTSPITPVFLSISGLEAIKDAIHILREEFHIFASGVMYPVVPRGVFLLRLVPSCRHTFDDVNKTIEAFIQIKERIIKKH